MTKKKKEKKTSPAPLPALRKTTGRKCSVCTHEQVQEINSAINKPRSFRVISRQFMGDAKHHDSIQRHAKNCLKLEIQALIKEQKIENAVNHYDEMLEQMQFAKDLRIAAREYLSDPTTKKLILIPRAREVQVIYEDYDDRTRDGEPKKKRENLDFLIDKLESVRQFQLELLKLDVERVFEKYDDDDDECVDLKADIGKILQNYKTNYINTLRTEIKHVDIRSFALDAIKTVDVVLDKFARVEGLYQRDKENRTDDEIISIRRALDKLAEENKTDFQTELQIFLADTRLKPEIKNKLITETVQ